MDKRKSVILSTLLGLVLPFGNIWGPLLVRCDREEQRKYRRAIVWSELAITVVSFIMGVGIIVVWMKDIVQMNEPKPINSTFLMCLFFGFSGRIICIRKYLVLTFEKGITEPTLQGTSST